MPNCVVDINFLKDPALQNYFQADPNNRVILTDFACMECYKGNSLTNISKSIQILSIYPKQVLVLKSTRLIIKAQHEVENVKEVEMVDENQTKGFSDFCKGVQLAVDGDQRYVDQILNFGRDAEAHFDRMLADTPKVQSGMQGIFSEELKVAIKSAEHYSEKQLLEIIAIIWRIALLSMKSHPDITAVSSNLEQLRDSHIFRYAVAAFSLTKWWMINGGIQSVQQEKLRNDVVDLTYVAYATRFDGFLSNDKRANAVYADSKELLERVFV